MRLKQRLPDFRLSSTPIPRPSWLRRDSAFVFRALRWLIIVMVVLQSIVVTILTTAAFFVVVMLGLLLGMRYAG